MMMRVGREGRGVNERERRRRSNKVIETNQDGSRRAVMAD
jgi:hypothetical protein